MNQRALQKQKEIIQKLLAWMKDHSFHVQKVSFISCPSSRDLAKRNGVREILKLCQLQDQSDLLKRTETLSENDKKDFEKQKKSLRVTSPIDVPVILVDDVVTSGTTLNACYSVLKEAGVNIVAVLSFASTNGKYGKCWNSQE